MANLNDVFRDDEQIMLAKPETTWRLTQVAPDVMKKLAATEPLIPELCTRMEKELPVQRSWAFGKFGAFVRPDRHVRAIYIDLAKVTGAVTAGGSIAIKGAEAVCNNFDQIIERLRNMWNVYGMTLGGMKQYLFHDPVMLSAMERFPVTEGKPPGVHPHWDALEEAEVALDFQMAHLARYGELAKAPIPLLVYRWPESVVENIYKMLEPHLSPKSLQTVKTEFGRGLGTNLYYYPQVPIRVMHLQAPDVTGAASMEERMRLLRQVTNPEKAIEGWIELTSRLLILGFVATDPANVSRGYCLQPQNLVIDGGFVDVNSLRRIETFKAEGEFKFAFTRTIQLLVHSISWFLVGAQAGSDFFRQCFVDVHSLVWNQVRNRIQSAVQRGDQLHPWLANVIREEGIAPDIIRTFRALLDLGEYTPGEQESNKYRKA